MEIQENPSELSNISMTLVVQKVIFFRCKRQNWLGNLVVGMFFFGLLGRNGGSEWVEEWLDWMIFVGFGNLGCDFFS